MWFSILNVSNFGGTHVYTLVSTSGRSLSFLKTIDILQISKGWCNMQFILSKVYLVMYMKLSYNVCAIFMGQFGLGYGRRA